MTAVVFEEVYFYANDAKTAQIGQIITSGDASGSVRIYSDYHRCVLEVPEADIRKLHEEEEFWRLFQG